MPMAREIFQEGLRIPPIPLVRRGKIDRGLLRLILANVRTPEEREGDLLAQLMAIHRSEVRLREMVDRYGLTVAGRNMSRLQQYSERMMRAAIRKLPDGEYRFEDFLDGDGISAEPVRIAVAVTIEGDSATVDFTGSAAQVSGPLNANYAIAIAATTYAFRCLIREEVPFTAGLMRPVTVIAPAGTVVNALPPAAMAAGKYGDVAADYRCSAGGALPSGAGSYPGCQFRHDEQPDLRRMGFTPRPTVRLLS